MMPATGLIKPSLLLITGMSGAGRSTSLRALEDIGYETIANLPLSLFQDIVKTELSTPGLAIEVDSRTRNFSSNEIAAIKQDFEARNDISFEMIFLDCNMDVLMRRYAETRRRHPLALNEAPLLGIERERTLLEPLRVQADTIIDTSAFNPHELAAEIQRHYGYGGIGDMHLSLSSFSFKRGLPRAADFVFDCRFLRNPHWEPALRPKTGLDHQVQSFIATDPQYTEFYEKIVELILFLLPIYRNEGRAHLSIGMGCTGGRHRSVAVTEDLARALAREGWQMAIRHRDLQEINITPDEMNKSGGDMVKRISEA